MNDDIVVVRLYFYSFLRATTVVLGQSPGSLSLRVLAMATPPPTMDHTHTSMAMPPNQNTSHHHPQRDALPRLGEGTPSQRALTLTVSMAK